MGAQPLLVAAPDAEKREKAGKIRGLYYHWTAERAWARALRRAESGSAVFIQFPVKAHSVWLYRVLEGLRRRGVRTIALVHDLEILRKVFCGGTSKSGGWRIRKEEVSALRAFDRVIAHNDKMKDFLTEKLELDGNRIISLEIFDYLIPGFTGRPEPGDRSSVIVAGNMNPDKSGYVYRLPGAPRFELYGADYQGETTGENVHYHGKLPPEELPSALAGGFGLVWDGPETETCSDVYGSYLRYNNPHKTSLYLASGIPVVIWEQAALAEFIRTQGCGITVSSLDEIAGILDRMTEKEYQRLVREAARVGEELRAGTYLKRAVNKCLE